MTTKLCLAQDPQADALLAEEPLALLIGMLLDQQFLEFWKLGASARAGLGG